MRYATRNAAAVRSGYLPTIAGLVRLVVPLLIFVLSGPALAARDEALAARTGEKIETRPRDPAQVATIERVVRFYEKVGMSDLAARVRKDFNEGKLIFDPEVRKENAATSAFVNPYTNRVHIDSGAVNGREVGPTGRGGTISLAATIFHEYIHVDQGRAYIQLKGQSTYETPAWTNQLQMTRGWLRDRVGALDKAQTPAEKIEILKDIAGCKATVGEMLVGVRENIASGTIERRSLTPQKLDQILADSNRIALEAIGRHETLLTDPANRQLAGNFKAILTQARLQSLPGDGKLADSTSLQSIKDTAAKDPLLKDRIAKQQKETADGLGDKKEGAAGDSKKDGGEKNIGDKVILDKSAREMLGNEKAEKEKAEKNGGEKAAKDRMAQDARERSKERAEKRRMEIEKAAREKAARERVARERAESAKAAAKAAAKNSAAARATKGPSLPPGTHEEVSGVAKDKHGSTKLTYIKDASGRVVGGYETYYDPQGKKTGEKRFNSPSPPPPPPSTRAESSKGQSSSDFAAEMRKKVGEATSKAVREIGQEMKPSYTKPAQPAGSVQSQSDCTGGPFGDCQRKIKPPIAKSPGRTRKPCGPGADPDDCY